MSDSFYIRDLTAVGPATREQGVPMDRKAWMDTTIKAALIGAAVLMYLDLISDIRSEIRNLGDKIDRVETKVDEVRGYLKFNASAPDLESPASDAEK